MEAWLIALAIVVIATIALLFVSIRVQLSLRGRGDPSGAWALAGGAQLGPLALSGVAARGVEPTLTAHVFGKKVWSRAVAELARSDDDETGALERVRDLGRRQRARYDRFERWFDPLDLVLFLLQERRRIRIDRLEADVGYSFEDVALTGKITAALYVLGGALPAPIVIRPDPQWEASDRADLALSGVIRLYPGLLLVDTALFVVRRVKLRKRPPPAPGPTPRREIPGGGEAT